MKTALVIEDSADNMELITVILEKNGYKTIRAERGQQGIELVMQRSPYFVILDIQLPDMNGLDVLKKIRESTINSDTFVIAMTSYAMTGDREKLLAAGCNGYIEKPIDPMRVIDQIREIIGE